MYNNKRIIENDDSSNNSNKKTKYNNHIEYSNNNSIDNNSNNSNSNNSNNSNSNNNQYENIINRNYNDIRLIELKEYANRIGVNSNGSKKVIYDRVLQLIQTQDTIAKENQEKESINSFNKGRVELTVKDIEPLEQSFWKVFRNKLIFKQIFSNFKFSKSFNYERLYDIIQIEYRFTNHIEIIRDKVKSGQYLNLNEDESLNYICLNFNKDTIENQLFMKQLLSDGYSKTISRIKLLKRAIGNSSLFIIQFINPSKNQILELEFKYSINRCGSKLFNYLVVSKNLNRDQLKQIYDLQSFKIDYSNISLKCIFQFVEFYSFIYQKDLKKDQISLLDSIKSSKSNFTKDQLKLSISSFINSITRIEDIKATSTLSSESSLASISASVSSLPSTESSTLTLNSNSILELKKAIENCIQLSNQFTQNKSIPLLHYLIFKDKKAIDYKLKFIKQYNEKEIKRHHDDIISYCTFRNLYLSKLELVESLIKDYIRDYSKVKHYLKEIISSNNIEFIQFIIKEFSIDIFNNDLETTLSNIDSTLVLDYFYNHHQQDFKLFADMNSNFKYFRDLKVLEHYEKLMGKLNRSIKVEHLSGKLHYSVSFEISVINRCLDNQGGVYNLSDKNGFISTISENISNHLLHQLGSEKNIESFKLLHQQSKFVKRFQFNVKIYHFIIKTNLDLIKSIFNNKLSSFPNILFNGGFAFKITRSGGNPDDQQDHIEIHVSNDVYLYWLYINGEYDKIVQDGHIEIQDIEKWLPLNPSIEFIDKLFSSLINNKSINLNQHTSTIKSFLNYVISYNNLELIKLFILKYSTVLFSKSNNSGSVSDIGGSSGPILNSKDIKTLLFQSIKNDNYYITDLLLNFVSITQSEYQKINNDKDSLVYINLYNRFK